MISILRTRFDLRMYFEGDDLTEGLHTLWPLDSDALPRYFGSDLKKMLTYKIMSLK